MQHTTKELETADQNLTVNVLKMDLEPFLLWLHTDIPQTVFKRLTIASDGCENLFFEYAFIYWSETQIV